MCICICIYIIDIYICMYICTYLYIFYIGHHAGKLGIPPSSCWKHLALVQGPCCFQAFCTETCIMQHSVNTDSEPLHRAHLPSQSRSSCAMLHPFGLCGSLPLTHHTTQIDHSDRTQCLSPQGIYAAGQSHLTYANAHVHAERGGGHCLFFAQVLPCIRARG